MLRKHLIVSLFIAGLTACVPIAPAPSVTEPPQDRNQTPVGQVVAQEAALPTPTVMPTSALGDLRLTILFDNPGIDPRLGSGWGFAAWVEYGGHTILFDTGADGSILLDNMRLLGLEPGSIEAIVLSHSHADHIGGLQALLDTGIRPTVYVPPMFPRSFTERVRAQTELVEVTETQEILPGVHLAGSYSVPVEQALVVETQDGTVVITGCAHPGIVYMVRQAQEVTPGKVALVAGGFHLMGKPASQVQPIVTELRDLGAQRVLPTHCTGDLAIELFRTEFGENCLAGGVGGVATSSTK